MPVPIASCRRPLRSALLSIVCCLTIALPAHAARLPADLGQRLVRDYIQPATQRFAQQGEVLQTALKTYCEKPADTQRRAAVEKQFGATVEAWAGIEFLRFGPLQQQNRLERIFFFPDPRGVTLRQIQALLASKDESALDAQALRGRSVAVQGLPALEFLLYGSGATFSGDDAGRYRCALAVAIAGNVRQLGLEVATAWRDNNGIAAEFATPSEQRSLYRSHGEVATETIKTLSTGLQFTRDMKLLPALGDSAEKANGRRAPLWRSDLTTRSLKANVRGLLDFYRAANLAAQLPEAERWIDDTLQSEGRFAIADLDAVTQPFEQAVGGGDDREALHHAALVLKNMQAVVVEYLAPGFGINLGFNSLDGD